MSDQATLLRDLVERDQLPRRGDCSRAPTLVTVCGAKGGVGTTTVAINLALALVRDGRPTALVDAAGRSCDIANYCDVPRHESIRDVLTGRRTLHEVLKPGPGGLLIVPGDASDADSSAINDRAWSRLLDQLSGLDKHAEFVVLDIGQGAAREAQHLMRFADRNLIVTAPDDASVVDAYAVLKHLARRMRGQLAATVMNLADDGLQARHVHARLSLACRRFLGATVAHAGHILRDRHLAEAAGRGRPALCDYPTMPGLFGFEALAERVVELAGSGAPSSEQMQRQR